MATAAELLQACREQTGLDADDAIALVVDFLASYGMTDNAADALCDYVDNEGLTEDFVSLLQENGLVPGPDDTAGEGAT